MSFEKDLRSFTPRTRPRAIYVAFAANRLGRRRKNRKWKMEKEKENEKEKRGEGKYIV